MLVLARKIGESIVARVTPAALAELAASGAGLELTITITNSNNRRASIGIEAPKFVHLARVELEPRKTTDAAD